MRGDLSIEMTSTKTFIRQLHPDRLYSATDGSELRLKGRSLMLVRNVGHLMTNPAISSDGSADSGEGIMDAVYDDFWQFT